ncbi:MAG TPA: nucleoside triphosphate pyrophosphohydrolase [Gemmatimonadales bacterium]
MQDTSALARILTLVRDLRKRCPWDAAQTLQTLRPYLVEEVLELDHALGAGDSARIRDELGDLLLHLAFQIVLAEERGEFGSEELARSVESKMWRRHPHLFPAGPAAAAERQSGKAAGAPASWEHQKLAERVPGGPGMLDGLPPNLPELIMAMRLQERAAGVGFDWPDESGPFAKVAEELEELRREAHADSDRDEDRRGETRRHEIEHEIGDLLFSVVNLARKLGHDPRAALEQANRRFVTRFRRMETFAAERGIDFGRTDLHTLDGLWEETKREG